MSVSASEKKRFNVTSIGELQTTKRKSLHAIYTRIVATLVGMAYAFLFFEIFGYSPIVLGIVLILFIPTIVSLGVVEGFIKTSLLTVYKLCHFRK